LAREDKPKSKDPANSTNEDIMAKKRKTARKTARKTTRKHAHKATKSTAKKTKARRTKRAKVSK